jgi:hypothetical protein
MTAKVKHNEQPSLDSRERNFGPILLIVIGVLALLLNLFQVTAFGLLILPVIGLLFLGWGIYADRFPMMIPGSILTGLGGALFIGVQLLHMGGSELGGLLMLGLSLGFVAIAIIAPLMGQRRHLWPLIPAAVLGVVAVALLADNLNLLVWLGSAWPLILIVIGVYLLVKKRGQSQASRP